MEKIITERLENKRAELAKRQEHFLILTEEMKLRNFESNAISDLLVMKKLKDEIDELELLLQLAVVNK